ncbi:MAG: dihydropteroate synthase [Candidatus Thorarchaeota archaeon]
MNSHIVRVNDLEIGNRHPVRVMGVVNLSSESFYKGSTVLDEDALLSRIQKLVKDGADIIDVGGASSAPKNIYSTADVSIEEELARIKQYMVTIVDSSDLPVSIDTMSSAVAEVALDLGAALVNDISGLQKDEKMARLVVDRDVPVVLMANCGKPCESVDSAYQSLKRSLEIAKSAGLNCEKIIVDPGIGFGKPAEIDLELIRDIRRFGLLSHPVLVGVSRKAFIGNILNQPNPDDRLSGTIAATTIAVSNGVDIVRTHDVEEAKIASTMGRALQRHRLAIEGDVELIGTCSEKEAEVLIELVGTSKRIRRVLARKALILNLLVRNIRTPSALIIKQEMLALGGDAAYHHDVIDHKISETDLFIMGTPFQLKRLSNKMKLMKYFGLTGVGEEISSILEQRG